jgi:sulfate transport system permease protein
MGLTLTWLSVIILIPLAGLFLKTLELSPGQFWEILTSRRTLNALKLSFGLSFAAACVNLVMGTIIVWALVRYRFPGRRLFDAIVDRGCGRGADAIVRAEGLARRSAG